MSHELVLKIPYYMAENILDTEYPMFDKKTNKLFGTKAVYIVLKDYEPVKVRVKNMNTYFDYDLNSDQMSNAIRYVNRLLKGKRAHLIVMDRYKDHVQDAKIRLLALKNWLIYKDQRTDIRNELSKAYEHLNNFYHLIE